MHFYEYIQFGNPLKFYGTGVLKMKKWNGSRFFLWKKLLGWTVKGLKLSNGCNEADGRVSETSVKHSPDRRVATPV